MCLASVRVLVNRNCRERNKYCRSWCRRILKNGSKCRKKMESNLQNKLQEFSATPPEGVWHKIADALDAQEPFAQRLQQYEEHPPVAVWSEIEKVLDEAVPAKVVPFGVRFRKP